MRNLFAILFGIWISATIGCFASADTHTSEPDIDISLNELYKHEFDYNGASYFRLYPEYREFIYDRPACREQLGEMCYQFLMCKDKSFDLCVVTGDEEWYVDSKRHAITE